jgi:hypothetical protein
MNQPKCQICGRDLENLDSINRGIGPECLAKREKFLAAAGSHDHEIAELALCGDPTVLRWLPKIAGAIGDGRQDLVNRFLDAARQAKARAANAREDTAREAEAQESCREFDLVTEADPAIFEKLPMTDLF